MRSSLAVAPVQRFVGRRRCSNVIVGINERLRQTLKFGLIGAPYGTKFLSHGTRQRTEGPPVQTRRGTAPSVIRLATWESTMGIERRESCVPRLPRPSPPFHRN